MLDIQSLRTISPSIIAIGSHRPIIQSMLDFDILSGRKTPSVKAIVATGRHFERYFFGNKEIHIPVFSSIEKSPEKVKNDINLFFNATSARRTTQSSVELLELMPNIIGGTIFAEDVPEKHSIDLYEYLKNQNDLKTNNKFVIGPASVGLIIPRHLKMGAIGGTDYRQLVDSDVLTPGNVAVLSASGGMVNEIIKVVAMKNRRLSFALSFGGDRFPVLSPKDAFISAQNDPETQSIVYYGELGGDDEHQIAELITQNKVTKKVICYIAGTVSELFENPPQFGHAKAMAKTKGETAKEKREILKSAGAIVPNTFTEFVESIGNLKSEPLQENKSLNTIVKTMDDRRTALITTSVSDDINGEASILGENLLSFVEKRSFASITASMFLGKKHISKDLEDFVDLVLRLAVDHGPYVSGAVNTIVTARAGRDLVSSLASGLLTIGPRFGGALNQAAINWLEGVTNNKSAYDFVEDFASKKIYIQGIGHRKYRVDFPDPRVNALLKYTERLEEKKFTNFASEVQKITTAKKGNLILNVDGAIAAIMLDILSEKEGMSSDELKKLTDIEFFNAFFVLSRSVGFISHFLDQKRLDEGLFRLPEEMVAKTEIE